MNHNETCLLRIVWTHKLECRRYVLDEPYSCLSNIQLQIFNIHCVKNRVPHMEGTPGEGDGDRERERYIHLYSIHTYLLPMYTYTCTYVCTYSTYHMIIYVCTCTILCMCVCMYVHTRSTRIYEWQSWDAGCSTQ